MRPLTIAITVLLLSGCGTATIYLKNGSSVDARIVRGDESSIHVLPVKKCEKRKKYETTKICFDEEKAIARSDIRDLDHPGNVSAKVGGLLGGLGLVYTFSILESRKNCTDSCFETGMATGIILIPAAIVAIVGTIVGLGGYISWLRSRNAAKVPEQPAGPKVAPVAMTDGERTYYGLGMIWNW